MTSTTTTAIPKTPRPSGISKWRAFVLVLVHVAIAAHVAHWMLAGETLGPLEPSEAITFSQNSVISAGLVFFILSITSTLVVGRWFCGWGCHLVAVQDLCLWMLKKIGIQPKPIRSRAFLLVPMAAFVYMFLYPAFYRMWFGIEFDAPRTEFVVDDFWATFPSWPLSVLTFLFAGFGAVYFLGSKGFCVNMCPYGAAYGVVDKLSPGRIRVTPACAGCGHCTQACTSNIVVHQEVRDYGMVVDQECLKCMDCVSVCPTNALYFGFGAPALFASPRAQEGKRPKRARDWWKIARWRNYSWPEEGLISVLYVACFFTFRDLYNSIPFLFALVIAALVTYWLLLGLRLFYKSNVKLQGISLKTGGTWTNLGKLYGLLCLGLLGFWAQSANVHYHRSQAEAGYVALNPVVENWLNSPRELTAEQETETTNALLHASKAEAGTPLSIVPREDWELSLITGWLNLLLGNDALFISKLEHASTIFEHNTIAHNGLANYYVAEKQLDKASEWFEKATLAAPDESSTWTLWAQHLMGFGKLAQAREVLTEASRSEHASAEVFLSMGRLGIASQDAALAIEGYQAALDFDPNLLEALLQLGALLGSTGEQAAGVAYFERALEIIPEDLELRLSTTLAYSNMGDLDKAEFHAREALRFASERPEPYVALSQIAAARGNEKEAQRLYAEAESRSVQSTEQEPAETP